MATNGAIVARTEAFLLGVNMNAEASGDVVQTGGTVGKLEASTATTELDATVAAAGRPHSAAPHGRRQPPPTAVRAARHAVASPWKLKYKDFVPLDLGRTRDSKAAVSVSDSCQNQFQ